MSDVIFLLKSELAAEELATLLGRIRAVAGVGAAAMLKPGSKSAEMRRTGYAKIADGDAQQIAERIGRIREVESVEVPEVRGLR